MVNDFSEVDFKKVMETYEYKCCLTGSIDKLTLDHVLPLAVGHGGTTYRNMLPLSLSLNSSKQAHNIFHWAEIHHARLGFTIERFYEVMTEVALRYGMPLEEYKKYYQWCFDNPKDIPTHYNGSNYYVSFQNRLTQVIDMYKEGATKQAIIEKTNIAETTLYKYLEIFDIEKRRPSLDTLEERLNTAIQMYEDGKVLKVIYEETRIHKSTLFNKIHELKLQTRIPNRLEDNENRIDMAVEMYQQGEKVNTIMWKARIGKKTLYNKLDELLIPRRR